MYHFRCNTISSTAKIATLSSLKYYVILIFVHECNKPVFRINYCKDAIHLGFRMWEIMFIIRIICERYLMAHSLCSLQ